jgi:hypothetical protein
VSPYSAHKCPLLRRAGSFPHHGKASYPTRILSYTVSPYSTPKCSLLRRAGSLPHGKASYPTLWVPILLQSVHCYVGQGVFLIMEKHLIPYTMSSYSAPKSSLMRRAGSFPHHGKASYPTLWAPILLLNVHCYVGQGVFLMEKHLILHCESLFCSKVFTVT